MNWSADEVAEVPPVVVTVTSTVPLPAGEVAVIEVAESTVMVARVARAEVDRGRTREVGAGDGHAGATGRSGRWSG